MYLCVQTGHRPAALARSLRHVSACRRGGYQQRSVCGGGRGLCGGRSAEGRDHVGAPDLDGQREDGQSGDVAGRASRQHAGQDWRAHPGAQRQGRLIKGGRQGHGAVRMPACYHQCHLCSIIVSIDGTPLPHPGPMWCTNCIVRGALCGLLWWIESEGLLCSVLLA